MPAATILVCTWHQDTQEKTFNPAWESPKKKVPQRRQKGEKDGWFG